jgi:AcrR family transcriptional regulator
MMHHMEALSESERPLRADAARNRVRILEAARSVFAERGMEGTLNDVAREAGVGIGTVYRKFADRDELVEALFEERLETHLGRLREAVADADPWHGFVSFMRLTCTEVAADRGLREVILGQCVGLDRLSQARERILPLAAELVDRAHCSGSLRSDFTAADIPLVFLMLGAVTDFSCPLTPDVWERFFVFLVDGLHANAAP